MTLMEFELKWERSIGFYELGEFHKDLEKLMRFYIDMGRRLKPIESPSAPGESAPEARNVQQKEKEGNVL